ncbi:hypothetical protein P7C70_g7539, partial [Phenoliferia sp. Uapishka_3]
MELSSHHYELLLQPWAPPAPAFPRLRPALYPDHLHTLPRHLNLLSRARTLPNEIIIMIINRVNIINHIEEEQGVDNADGSWVSEHYCSRPRRQQTLARCCRVSRFFQHVAERLLYRSLHFDFVHYRWKSNHTVDLTWVLEETPRLASHVEELRVQVNGDETMELGDVLPTLSGLRDLRILIRRWNWTTYKSLSVLITLQAELHPNAGLRHITLRIYSEKLSPPFMPYKPYDNDLAELLSSLPCTLTSLELMCPPVRPLGPAVKFSLSQLHLVQPHFDSSLLTYLTARSQTTLFSLNLETTYHSCPDLFLFWEPRRGSSLRALLTRDDFKSVESYPLRFLGFMGFELDK